MKRLIIIDHEPLSLRRKEIFCIDELSKRGMDVEFWDMSQYFHKGMFVPDMEKTDYLSVISTLEAFQAKLEKIEIGETLFIIEAPQHYEYRHFFKLLKTKACFCVKLELYATTLSGGLSNWHKLKLIDRKKLFRVLQNRFKSLLNKIYYKIHNIHVYDLYISSGSNPLIDVHINHPDWEKAQLLKSSDERLVTGRYAVFCDEYFPLHPDILFFDKVKIDNLTEWVARYRNAMCSFFSMVENKYGIQVVVAAHPKSDYKEGDWGKRLIFKYKTPELVKDCEFVLFHISTSISYAFIFNKPLLMLTTSDYKKIKSLYYYQLYTAKYFGLHIHDIEHEHEVAPDVMTEEKRKDYVYGFLTTSDVERRKNADILYEALNSGGILINF